MNFYSEGKACLQLETKLFFLGVDFNFLCAHRYLVILKLRYMHYIPRPKKQNRTCYFTAIVKYEFRQKFTFLRLDKTDLQKGLMEARLSLIIISASKVNS